MERGARLGRWIVQRELGRGGMGVVFEALPVEGGAPVALKVVLLDPRDPAAAARAEREARALFAVRHPGVAAVLDVEASPGRLVLATELVRGESLHSRVLRGGPLAPDEVVDLGRELALALEAAHEEGVVHRDVTPRNVLLALDGGVKLIDFGLARLASPTEERLTTTGEVLGTPAFMAPEQADGRAHEADARTDVYGLGATLYWALCGKAPFSGAGALEVLQQVLVRAPTPPGLLRPGIPVALEGLVLRCLAKDPAARPDSAAAFGDLLAEVRLARPTRLRGAAAAVALVAALAATLAVLAPRRLDPTPQPLASPAGPPLAGPPDPAVVSTPVVADQGTPPDDLPDAADAELVALVARGELETARPRVEALRQASPARRVGLAVAACQDLDTPLPLLLLWAAVSLDELRVAARALEARGAERAALRARLAAVSMGEAEPDELERLAFRATRCRAPAPLALLERACAAHPTHAGLAVARLVALWRSAADPRPVEEVEAGLARLPPGAPPDWARILTARVAVTRGAVDEAVALLATVQREPEAAVDRASLLHRLGRRAEAQTEFARAIAAAPTAPTFRFIRALVATEGPPYADPLEDLDAALAADPWHADALQLRAKLRHNLGDEAGVLDDMRALARVGTRRDLVEACALRCTLGPFPALAAAERLARLGQEAPFDVADVRRQLTDGLDGPQLREQARLLLRAGAGKTALELVELLDARDEALAGDVDLRVQALVGLLARYDEALRVAEAGAARWPLEASAHAALALARLVRGKWDEARRAADEALRLDPACPRALHVHARLKLLARDGAGALAGFLAAADAAPGDPWIAADLGGVLQEAGRLAEADRVLAAAQRAAPGWWRPYYLGALAEQTAGRPAEALRLLGAALTADDRHAGAWVLRARARLALGDPLGALGDLEAVRPDEGELADWLLTAVDARVGAGDVSGALAVVERASPEHRPRLARRCEELARRVWWTAEERARLAGLPLPPR